jgi:cell division transport system permease protein
MSGSFDRPSRPTGRPAVPAVQAAFDPYEDESAPTAPSTGGRSPRESGPRPMMEVEPSNWDTERVPAPQPQSAPLYAEARTVAEPSARRKQTQIVPAGSVTGRSLTLVIAIMCFLACLTAGAVYMITNSADAWLRDMASEVTVQVEPQGATDIEKVIKETVALLTKTPGVTSVKALTIDDSAALLEPWLGQADVLKSLPVPRLIALEIDRNSPPDLDALRQKLTTGFNGVTLDDHRHWQQQIRTVTRSFALGGFMILLLVAAATIAIIVSATRSSMASNRDIVEVLHFVGATDRFIAREFERHFLKLGVRAGLVGALAAGLVFFVAPTLVELIGGQTISAAELHRLVGSGALEVWGYAWMVLVVLVISGLCMLTSRLGVFRILNSRI